MENMHLHWKHRDLVKVICKERDRAAVDAAAEELEAASGGIWVATFPVKKVHAIVFYRGKNYQRPAQLRPAGLLTKRQALKRALEMQRKKVCAPCPAPFPKLSPCGAPAADPSAACPQRQWGQGCPGP